MRRALWLVLIATLLFGCSKAPEDVASKTRAKKPAPVPGPVMKDRNPYTESDGDWVQVSAQTQIPLYPGSKKSSLTYQDQPGIRIYTMAMTSNDVPDMVTDFYKAKTGWQARSSTGKMTLQGTTTGGTSGSVTITKTDTGSGIVILSRVPATSPSVTAPPGPASANQVTPPPQSPGPSVSPNPFQKPGAKPDPNKPQPDPPDPSATGTTGSTGSTCQ